MRMRPPDAGPVRIACVGLLTVIAVSGCSGSDPQTSADCAAQVRVNGVVYTSYGITDRRAKKHSTAEQADCQDVGQDATGSVFPEQPHHVTTWEFPGYSPAKVLGVRYGDDSFGVFLAESLGPDERERVYADLTRAP